MGKQQKKYDFSAFDKEAGLDFSAFDNEVKKKADSQSGTQDSASGFAPSQGIKPGTSIFPQQQFSVEEQAKPMPVEQRYKEPQAKGGAVELSKYFYDKAIGGIGKMSSGMTDVFTQIAVQIAPEEFLGGKTKEEVVETTRKEMLPTIREGIVKVAGTNQEKVDKKRYDDNFITGAIGGAVESLPAIASPYGIGFFAQAYDGGLESINRSKVADELSETEKTIFAGSVGAVGAMLEKYGMDKIFGSQSKLINEFSEKVALKVLDKFAKEGVQNVTPKMFNQAASQIVAESAKRLTKAGGNIVRAGGIEGITGGSQEAGTIGIEEVFNQYKGKQIFENGSWGEMIGRVGKAAGQEAIGGGALRGGFDAIRGTADIITGNFTPKTIREVAIVGTPEQVEQVVTALDEQLQKGKITPEEHSQGISILESTQQIDATIPKDLSGEARLEANELITMRNDLDDAIAFISEEREATDPAFRTSYDSRIESEESKKAVINDAIVGLTAPVIYRQVEGGFQKESNGKTEDITEAQFNFAKDNGFTGIKIEEQGSAVAEGSGAVTEHGGAVVKNNSTFEGFPKPPKPISEMTSSEMEEHAKALREYDKSLFEKIFGKEGAKKYRDAQSVSNSMFADRDRQKEADKIIDEMESALTEEQRNALFGIGEDDGGIYDYREVNDLANSISSIEQSENVGEVAGLVRNALRNFNPQKPSVESTAILNAAKRRMQELSISPETLVAEVIRKVGNDYQDAEDAEFMMRDYLGKILSNTTNATKESSQQVIQGDEQGNQLQREGTQEGQPQIGQGEGSIGQTTQPETNIGNSDQQGEGQEEVSGPPSLLPPTTMQGPTIPQPIQSSGNTPSVPTPPTSGVSNSQQGPASSPRSVERTRREMLENLPKKKKGVGEWLSKFFEETTDDKYRIAKFLRDNGGKLVEAYMRLRQGASGAAKAFSENIRKSIFGDLSTKKNIKYLDTEGNEVETSERELLDGVITSRRVLNIDEMLRKRFNDMMALRPKILNGTATPQEKAKFKDDIEYLRERKAIPPQGIPVYQEQKGEDGLTVANHKAFLLNLDNQLPPELVQKIADKALEYNKFFKELLTEQYNAGVFNKEQYDALMEQDYAPRAFWERMMQEDMPSLGQREFMSKLNQGLKALQGGSEKLVYAEYEALMDMMAVAAFKRILENKAAISLAEFVKANPNNGIVSEAETEKDSFGNTKYDKFGNPKYVSKEGRGSIIYYDKGVKKRLDVPTDFETIWYSSRDYISPEFAKKLRQWTGVNLIKKGATEWNIRFGVMQFFLLDAPFVQMFNDTYSPLPGVGSAQFLLDVKAVAKDLKNKTGIWKEAAQAGAFSNLMSRDEDLTDPTRYMNKKDSKATQGFKKFIKASADVNEYFESLTRMAVYNRKKNDLMAAYKKANGKEAQKGTKDYQDIVAEAAYAAKSTVDFGKSGRTSKAANNFLAYLTAAVATFNTSLSYMKNNPAEFTFKVAQYGSALAGLTLLNLGYFDDDDKEEQKRKQKIISEVPDYVLRNKVIYVPSKDEIPFFKSLGMMDDNSEYVVIMPKIQIANFFANAMEDAAVEIWMPEYAEKSGRTMAKKTLEGIATDLSNSVPFDPRNIASRQPLIAAGLAANNYDAFRKQYIEFDQTKPKYQQGQDKETVAPFYKAAGQLSKDIFGGEGISPSISQAVVEKVITNPEKNPMFNLFFQPLSYGAVAATDDKILMDEFKERFDPTLGMLNSFKGSPARRKREESDVLSIKDKKIYVYDGKKALQNLILGGANDEQINKMIDKLVSKETLSELKNLKLSEEDIKQSKDDFKEYAKQVKAIYVKDMPEWFSEIPKERSNEDKAKEILFNTSGMKREDRDKILRQLIDNKFINSDIKEGSVRWHLKQLQNK